MLLVDRNKISSNNMEEEWQHRFKVVKIATKEPRKRGRWSCTDSDPRATNSESTINPNHPPNATSSTTPHVTTHLTPAPTSAPGSSPSPAVGPATATTTTPATPATSVITTEPSNVNRNNNLSTLEGTAGSVNLPSQGDNKCTSNQGSDGIVVDEKTFDHLMFAVREEVVVLKERINELMSKISQLEFENGILKAHATPKALELLSHQQSEYHHNSPNQQPNQQATPRQEQNHEAKSSTIDQEKEKAENNKKTSSK